METETPQYSVETDAPLSIELAEGLERASLNLQLAEEALRSIKVAPPKPGQEVESLRVLIGLNDCSTRTAAIHHGLMRLGEDLKRLHFGDTDSNL
jgi:hypothetical protein